MCLYNPVEVEIQEPRKVLKVLYRARDLENGSVVVMTPFKHTEVPQEVLSGEKPFKARLLGWNPSDEPESINEGYVHCYSGYEGLLNDIEYYLVMCGGQLDNEKENDFAYCELMVFECEIPASKNAKYCWENKTTQDICARQVKFLRRVPVDELLEELKKVFEKRNGISYKKILGNFWEGPNFYLCDTIKKYERDENANRP